MDTSQLNDALTGRYSIERELGAGGMAHVFLARDLRHGRLVALKVMRPELAATLGAERFLREIRTAAQLQHPHILPLHDSGEAAGFLYFVMPYVEGESLRGRLRHGALPLAEAARLVRDVVDALSHAHARGVVHRDIKPDNVLISGRHALVTDFGVAKAVSDATGRHELTTVGVALGTPTYMAPEQAAADPNIDHRADIYACGVLAYELLTGRPPFTGNSPQQILVGHLTQPPPPLETLRADVPPQLAFAVMRCLEKAPEQRWQSADELLPHLELFATSGGATPTTVPPMTPTRSDTEGPVPLWRRRSAQGAALLILTIGIIAALIPFGRRAEATAVPRIVVLPPSTIGGTAQSDVAEGIAEEVHNRLVGLRGMEVIGRASANRYRDTKSLTTIGTELHAGYILTLSIGSDASAAHRIRVNAELIRAANEAAIWSRKYTIDSTSDNLRMQADIADSVARWMDVRVGDADRVTPRQTNDQEAYDNYLRGKPLSELQSVTGLSDAVRYLRPAVERDPNFAAAWAALGTAHIRLFWFAGRRDEDLRLAREAAERAKALAPNDAATQVLLGLIAYYGSYDYSAALLHLNAAIAAEPGNAEYLAHAAAVLRRSGNYEAALERLQRAHALNPRHAQIMGDALSGTLFALGRPAEARAWADSGAALAPDDWVHGWSAAISELRQGHFAIVDSILARVLLVRPGIQRVLVDRPQLLTQFGGWLSVATRNRLADAFPALSSSIRDTAGYLLARASVLDVAGRDARSAYAEAASAWERRVAERPGEGWGHAWLGASYRGLGRFEQAIEEGRKSVDLLAPDRFESSGARMNLLLAYLAAGDRERAADEFERIHGNGRGDAQWMRYDPRIAALREMPRVKAILSGDKDDRR